jgi:hypothetical protein
LRCKVDASYVRSASSREFLEDNRAATPTTSLSAATAARQGFINRSTTKRSYRVSLQHVERTQRNPYGLASKLGDRNGTFRRNDQIAHDNRFGVWMRRIVFLIFTAYESRKFPVSIVIELFADTPYSRTGPSRGVSPHPEAAR